MERVIIHRIPKKRQYPLNLDPWQRYTPPPLYILKLIKGCKCRRHEHTAPGEHWERRSRAKLEIAAFFVWGRGYNAARGLTSREITKKAITSFFLGILACFLKEPSNIYCKCLDIFLNSDLFFVYLWNLCSRVVNSKRLFCSLKAGVKSSY